MDTQMLEQDTALVTEELLDSSSLLDSLPGLIAAPHFTELENNAAFRLKRIVVKGHATPHGQWHDQSFNEWVMLLKGAARLEFEGQSQMIAMLPGDYIAIQAHQRHRIDWTDPDCETIWLALDYGRNL